MVKAPNFYSTYYLSVNVAVDAKWMRSVPMRNKTDDARVILTPFSYFSSQIVQTCC